MLEPLLWQGSTSIHSDQCQRLDNKLITQFSLFWKLTNFLYNERILHSTMSQYHSHFYNNNKKTVHNFHCLYKILCHIPNTIIKKSHWQWVTLSLSCFSFFFFFKSNLHCNKDHHKKTSGHSVDIYHNGRQVWKNTFSLISCIPFHADIHVFAWRITYCCVHLRCQLWIAKGFKKITLSVVYLKLI